MVFNLASLLPAGLSLIGGMFGNGADATKTSTNQNTTTTGTGTTGVVQTATGKTDSTTNQSSTQNTNSSTTQNQNTTGTQSEAQNLISAITEAMNGMSSSSTNRLDQATTDQLRAQVQTLMGGTTQNSAVIEAELSKLMASPSGFDPETFVNGIMGGAKLASADNVESGTNQLIGQIGSGKNSAAILLKDRLNRNANTELASTEAQARGQAATIQQNEQQSRASAISALTGAKTNDLSTMLGALLNVGETTQGSSSQTSNQGQNQQTTGNTNTGQTTTGTTGSTSATTGTTNQTSSQTDNSAQTQATNQTSTENTQTGQTSTTGANKNWADMLSSLGTIFGAKF